MSKIDTQGMSGPAIEGGKDNIYPRDENGEPIYPPFNPTPLPLIEPKLKEEPVSYTHLTLPTTPYV